MRRGRRLPNDYTEPLYQWLNKDSVSRSSTEIHLISQKFPSQFNFEALAQAFHKIESQADYRVKVACVRLGCTIVIIEVSSPEEAAEWLMNPVFRTALAETDVQVVMRKTKGVPIDIQNDRIEIEHMDDKSPPANLDTKVDFALITALPDVEFKPLRKALDRVGIPGHKTKTETTTTYHYSVKNDSDKDMHVAAMHLIDMGTVAAAQALERICTSLDPERILMIGIAGSLDDTDVSLGDVVLARQIFDYDSRRKHSDKGTDAAPSAYPTDRGLVSEAQSLLVDDDEYGIWKQYCHSVLAAELKNQLPNTWAGPTLHIGDIACGDAVVNSLKEKKRIKSLNRKLLATEMESSGLMEAAFNRHDVKKVTVIRGISDPAEKKDITDPCWRTVAALCAVECAISLISRT